jgi:hypothetical protein
MLSADEAEEHFEECIRDLRGSLYEGVAVELLKSRNKLSN